MIFSGGIPIGTYNCTTEKELLNLIYKKGFYQAAQYHL